MLNKGFTVCKACKPCNKLEDTRLVLQLQNAVVRCIFRLAGRTKILKLPGVNVTDDKNHTIIVKRLGNYATLQVDYAGKIEGSTGGTSHLMNHGGGALFAGGVLINLCLNHYVFNFSSEQSGSNFFIKKETSILLAKHCLLKPFTFFSGPSLCDCSFRAFHQTPF